MDAEIIAIGDELTSGQSLDTNSQWIARRLESLGVATLYHTTVGDRLAPCADVFRRAFERADIVAITGGLGPTDDDLTRDALAEAAGCELALDAEELERIREIFARRGWPMPPQNERQAWCPAGGRTIRNPHGTAPGIDLTVPREGREPCRAFALPGVPAEMFDMWSESVEPVIADMIGSRRVIVRRKINCFGAGESRIEEMLPGLISREHTPTVGITAGHATISLRIAAEGATEEECRAAIEPVERTIREKLGTLVFGAEDEQLQDAVAELLRRRGKTIFTAECFTAGLLANWLSEVPGSADFYQGGMILNALDEPVEQAAIRCRERLNADYGLAIGTPAGTKESAADDTPHPCEEARDERGDSIWIPAALASADGVTTGKLRYVSHPSLHRAFVAKQALNALRLELLSATRQA